MLLKWSGERALHGEASSYNYALPHDTEDVAEHDESCTLVRNWEGTHYFTLEHTEVRKSNVQQLITSTN